MNTSSILYLIAPLSVIGLTSCTIDDTTGSAAAPSQSQSSHGQPMTVVKGQGSVVIMEGTRRVSVCTTASPNIEQTRFINEQQQIVVKSRGNHGPATVQLFNTSTGKEEGRVKAFEIKNGQPAWAAGMGE